MDLKEKLIDLETKYSSVSLQYEKNDVTQQQKIQNLENEKKNISLVLKLYEDERKQYKDRELNQNELQSKLNEVRYLLERQSGEHRKEIEKVQQENTLVINNLKALAESVSLYIIFIPLKFLG